MLPVRFIYCFRLKPDNRIESPRQVQKLFSATVNCYSGVSAVFWSNVDILIINLFFFAFRFAARLQLAIKLLMCFSTLFFLSGAHRTEWKKPYESVSIDESKESDERRSHGEQQSARIHWLFWLGILSVTFLPLQHHWRQTFKLVAVPLSVLRQLFCGGDSFRSGGIRFNG